MERGWIKLLLYLALFLSFPTHAHGQVNYVPGEVIVKVKGKPGFTMQQAGSSFSSKASARGMKVQRNFDKMGVMHMSTSAGQNVQQLINEPQADHDIEYAEP